MVEELKEVKDLVEKECNSNSLLNKCAYFLQEETNKKVTKCILNGIKLAKKKKEYENTIKTLKEERKIKSALN